MTTLIAIGVLLGIIGGLLSKKKQRTQGQTIQRKTSNEPRIVVNPPNNDYGITGPNTHGPKYNDRPRLLNYSEQRLYKRLMEAVPAFTVFAQVSMSQIFVLSPRYRDKLQQLTEVGRKSVDFLICRADTSIVCAIELNGPHHDREDRKRSDATKRRALEEAGIPLLIFYPDSIPEISDIRKAIAHALRERRKHEEKRNR